MENKVKNQYIDLLKGFACIIVIFLHCPFPGIVGEGIIYGIRFSVPVFFMVSGYFSYSKSERWIKDKAKYIFKLIIYTELFYGMWEFVKACLIDKLSAGEALHNILSGKNIIQVIFCGSAFNGTLWYLYAIFWTWIIILILRRFKLYENAFYAIPVLLVVLIFGRLYVQNAFDIYKYVYLFRNALTFGLPFTLLGSYLAKNKDKIKKNIDFGKNVVICIAGMMILVSEYVFVGQYMDVHISTVVISAALFIMAMNAQKPMNKELGIFEYIGGKLYTWVYLSHIFFVDVTGIIYDNMNLGGNVIADYTKPVIVCVFACLCSYLIIKIRLTDFFK